MITDHQAKDNDQVSPEALPAPRKRIKLNQPERDVSSDEEITRKLNELALVVNPPKKATDEFKLGELQQAIENVMKEPLKSITQNVNRAIKQVMDVQEEQAQAMHEIQGRIKSSAITN